MKFLEEQLVKVGADAIEAKEAIKQAGKLLLDDDLIEDSYLDAMVNSYGKNGPYFVLAPNIAIPHARPEDGVKEASVSLIQLKEPVVFGHASNDPVLLVFGLGASSSEEHLTLLRKLTTLLNNSDNVKHLTEAVSYNDIKNIINMEGSK